MLAHVSATICGHEKPSPQSHSGNHTKGDRRAEAQRVAPGDAPGVAQRKPLAETHHLRRHATVLTYRFFRMPSERKAFDVRLIAPSKAWLPARWAARLALLAR